MLLNVAYYAIDPPLLVHVILSIKIELMIKYYNNNVISLFGCIGALTRYTLMTTAVDMKLTP